MGGEFQNVYIRPCSAVDLAQSDLGITRVYSIFGYAKGFAGLGSKYYLYMHFHFDRVGKCYGVDV